MPKISYEDWSPRPETRVKIEQANEIAVEYGRMGYSLTLRQLYYRFVSNAWIPNTDRSYKNLGSIVNRARMSGLMDWNHITDRTRNHVAPSTWNSPEDIMRSARDGYSEDMWRDQPFRPEVWVEKDALVQVIGQAADKFDVPYFSCRGYTSSSSMWRAGQRMIRHLEGGQRPRVIHLGDHDPSGIDMTRDIYERLHTFIGSDGRLWEIARDAGFDSPYTWAADKFPGAMDGEDDWTRVAFFGVSRIALNMDQIDEYNPPPNPTKLTDSRAEDYILNYGYDSWELDALEPQVLDGLIVSAIEDIRDEDIYDLVYEDQEENRQKIADAIEHVIG